MQNPFESDIRLDAVINNTAIGLGTSRDKLAQTTVGNRYYLHWREKQKLFAGDWLIQRICSILPQKVQEAGWALKLGDKEDDKTIAEMDVYVKSLFTNNKIQSTGTNIPVPNLQDYEADRSMDNPTIGSVEDIFRMAQTTANVEDGCVILINVDDGRMPHEPIDPKNIRKVIGLELLKRKEVRPAWEYDRNYYDPTWYQITLEKRTVTSKDKGGIDFSSGKQIFVHRSRILRFDGLSQAGDEQLMSNEGWNGSIIDTIWEDYKTWRVAIRSTASTLSDGSLFLYKLRNLRDLVAQGKENFLNRRIQIMVQHMSTMGGIAVDMNDEDVSFLSRPYTGVDNLLQTYINGIVAATGYPHTLILGDSPSGLGATGESEMRAIEDLKREAFENQYYGKLKYLYRILFLCKESPTKGKEPKEWDISYKGKYVPSQQEGLANLNAFVSALSGAIAAGFMTPDEARLSFKGAEPRYEIILDDAAWKKQKEQAQQQPDMYGGFGGDNSFGGEDQQGDQPAPNDVLLQ